MMQTWLYQAPLFSVESQPALINVYHDESGCYGNSRWFIVGLLFVPQHRESEILMALRHARSEIGYEGEVHFSALPKGWGGEGGAKSRLAKRWLRLFAENLAGACTFYALAVDTHSPRFDHKRFPQKFHMYNRFTRMALVSAISWQMSNYDCLELQIFSDDKFRQRGRDQMVGQPGSDWDNFEDYLPRSVAQDLNQRRQGHPHKYPDVRCTGSVNVVDSDPDKVVSSLRDKCQLVQLTDVLLGAIAQAITASSSWPTKQVLGLIAAEWIQDTRKPPWEQKLGLHKKFAVSYFPDSNGAAYTDGPLRILTTARQEQPLLL